MEPLQTWTKNVKGQIRWLSEKRAHTTVIRDYYDLRWHFTISCYLLVHNIHLGVWRAASLFACKSISCCSQEFGFMLETQRLLSAKPNSNHDCHCSKSSAGFLEEQTKSFSATYLFGNFNFCKIVTISMTLFMKLVMKISNLQHLIKYLTLIHFIIML